MSKSESVVGPSASFTLGVPISQHQRVHWAKFFYKRSSKEDWAAVEPAYEVSKWFAGSVCDVFIDHTGISISQVSTWEEPHTQQVGARKVERVRCKVSFARANTEEWCFSERAATDDMGSEVTLITMTWTVNAPPTVCDNSYVADIENAPEDPAGRLAELGQESMELPLAQWANSFAQVQPFQLRLEMKRSRGTSSKAKLFRFPAVIDFLHGAEWFKRFGNHETMEKLCLAPLSELMNHSRYGSFLEKSGDDYKLLPPPPPPQPRPPPPPPPTSLPPPLLHQGPHSIPPRPSLSLPALPPAPQRQSQPPRPSQNRPHASGLPPRPNVGLPPKPAAGQKRPWQP